MDLFTQDSQSESINELASALCLAQLEFSSLKRDEQGYGYNYVSLNSTIDAVRPILAKHGLVVSQLAGNDGEGRPAITTILMHKSGQYIKGKASMHLIEMKGVNDAQKAGAVYSYIRRYALQAILNLGAEDNDASSEGFNKPTKEVKSTEKRPQKFRREVFSKDKGTSDELDL